MSFESPFGIRVLNPTPVASRLYNLAGELYINTGQVLTENTATRYIGEMYLVSDGGSAKIYWFKDGVTDLDLIEFDPAAGQYLPLDGGDLTGNLNGTTASFSGNVSIGSKLNNAGGYQVINGGGSGNVLMYFGNTALDTLVFQAATKIEFQSSSVFQNHITGTSGSFSGLISAPTLPTLPEHLVNKEYIDDALVDVDGEIYLRRDGALPMLGQLNGTAVLMQSYVKSESALGVKLHNLHSDLGSEILTLFVNGTGSMINFIGTPASRAMVPVLMNATDIGSDIFRFKNGYFEGFVIGESVPTAANHLTNKAYVDSVTGSSTGLEAIDEGNGIGWRLIGRNPADYANIGTGAVDFSLQGGNAGGATGLYAFAACYNGTASGYGAAVFGTACISSHQGSIAAGNKTITGRDAQAVFGLRNEGRSDTLMEVGLGSGLNGFEVRDDGKVIASQSASITENRQLVTKEYADSLSPTIPDVDQSDVQIFNSNTGTGYIHTGTFRIYNSDPAAATSIGVSMKSINGQNFDGQFNAMGVVGGYITFQSTIEPLNYVTYRIDSLSGIGPNQTPYAAFLVTFISGGSKPFVNGVEYKLFLTLGGTA